MCGLPAFGPFPSQGIGTVGPHKTARANDLPEPAVAEQTHATDEARVGARLQFIGTHCRPARSRDYRTESRVRALLCQALAAVAAMLQTPAETIRSLTCRSKTG